MVSLLRTLRSIRRVGLKEYVRQMWYIGDAKSGRFVGADKFGNRYFENNNAEEEIPGTPCWLFHTSDQGTDFLGFRAPSLGGLPPARVQRFSNTCRMAR
ncbi:hypothetical protein FRC08_006362, partial [Ceratobasidium sp. 394]